MQQSYHFVDAARHSERALRGYLQINESAVVSTADLLSNMRDSKHVHGGVPFTIVIEPENDCFADSSDEEEEEEDPVAPSTSSSICSGVYFNNTEISVPNVPHPLQSRPVLIGEPQGMNVPNGRPLPCPPKLVILGGSVEPRHCNVRSSSHCDYRKLKTSASTTPEPSSSTRKRQKVEEWERKAQSERVAASRIDCRHTILSEEQQMFVEAAAALKEASAKPNESWTSPHHQPNDSPLRIASAALPPPPYRLPDSVVLKLLSKPQP